MSQVTIEVDLPTDNKPFRRWMLRAAFIVVAILVAVAIVGWLVFGGSNPMVNGERLADGRVTVVVDGFSAAYVVELPAGLVLVDAGMDPEAAAIRAALTGSGKSPEDVTAILLTHGHEDHITGATAFPNARVFALAAETDLVVGARVPDNIFGLFSDPSPTGIEVDVEVSDSDTVEIAGGSIEVFALPGHTRGSAAYLINGVLFLGDSAGANDDGTMHPAPPVFSNDRAENRASLHRLAERLTGREKEIDAMVFGHQGPLYGIGALMEWHQQDR
jgi:glyoxylase-like metal-dependent hydrolase (beta-lactamase superfamily II)